MTSPHSFTAADHESSVLAVGLSLEEVHNRHAEWLRNLCGRLLGHRDALEVDDAVQQVFIIYANLEEDIHDERAMVAWLRRTALHLCANIARSRKSRRNREQQVGREQGAQMPHADHHLAVELERAIDQLPPDLRQVVEFRYFDGLTPGEIAEVTNSKPATVRKRQQRALEALREHLGKHARKGLVLLAFLSATGPLQADEGSLVEEQMVDSDAMSWWESLTHVHMRGRMAALGTAAACVIGLSLWFSQGISEKQQVLTHGEPNVPKLVDVKVSGMPESSSVIQGEGVEPQFPTEELSDLRAEIQPHRRYCRLADVLISFDTNNNARMDHNEKIAAQDYLRKKLSEKKCNQVWDLWKEIDEDRDGELSYEEYLVHYGRDVNSKKKQG